MVLGTQLVLDRRKQARENKTKRGEKLEQLVAALYEHDHWLGRIIKDQENVNVEVPAYARMQAIQSVYFHELYPYFVEYAESSSAIIDAAKKPLTLNSELINSYRECFKSVWGSIDQCARRERFLQSGKTQPLWVHFKESLRKSFRSY